MKKHKKKLLVVVAAVLLATLSAFVLNSNQSKPKHLSDPTLGEELNIQIGLVDERKPYKVGDDIIFKSYISNPGTETKSYTFNSTCTQGTLFIDEKPTQQVQVCGQAITPVNIAPGDTISFEYAFRLVDQFTNETTADLIEYEGELKLTPEDHNAQLEWQGVKSDLLGFTIE